MNLEKVILIPIVLFSPIALSTPSFICGSNLTPVEQKICDEDELSKIDNTMVRIYKSIFQTKYIAESSKEEIKTSQHKWRSSRNSCAKLLDIKACIKDEYIKRIKTLRTSISSTPSHRLYVEGNKFNDNKDTYNSLRKYKEAYEIADNISDKVQPLGALYFVDKKNSSSYLKTLLEIDPKNDFALNLLGRNKPSMKENKEATNLHEVSISKKYDLKGKIKHYHERTKGGRTLHSHIFPPSKWNHVHKNFLKAQPFQTEKEKEISNLDYNSWKSLHNFLLKNGNLKTEVVKKAYRSIFKLHNQNKTPVSDREFEANIIRYTKNFLKYIKINILDQSFENTKTINILPDTWFNNFHLTNSNMKVKISAERKENSGYSLKYDHDILLELRLKVSMFTEVNMGWFPIGSVTPMSDTTKKIRISLNKGNGNPVSFSFKEVTNSAGISAVNKGAERLTNGFIKVKSKMYYSLKYKILSVD